MDVLRPLVLQRELGQLEVVGREQREGAVLLVQVVGDRAGQREAVEGRGAAADLVHQHQRLLGRAMDDCRRLGHLDHEGRLRVGQVVGGADPGVDRVDRPEPARRRRHVRADRGEQDDQRDLAHEGALAAHVRAGDDEHPALGVEPAVVGHERRAAFLQPRLDDRMAAALDLDQRLLDEARPAPVGAARLLGERRTARRSPPASARPPRSPRGAARARRAAPRRAPSRAPARVRRPRAPCPRTPSARA